jgi:uroporphyrinogen-III synthase
MKTSIVKRIGTGIFVATLLMATTLSAKNKVTEPSEKEIKTEVKESKRCVYVGPQIVAYLEELGYTKITLTYIPGSCNMLATTSNSYSTTIYVSGTAIVGHDDLDM